MPGGTDYGGPTEALQEYAQAVAASGDGATVKGARNPYTSHNGHMYSFINAAGGMALRLSDELRVEFLDRYDSGPVMSYGSVMRGYVTVPETLLADTAELARWLRRSRTWIATLAPKPTR